MITINLVAIFEWVVVILAAGAGVLGLIAWFSTGDINIAFLGIATLLLALCFILPIFEVDIKILNYITMIGAPLFYIVGFVLTMKHK